MSDTEQLFILAGIWTIGAAIIAYFIPKWPAKIVAFALLVGIPFWELPFGYYNFSNLCKRDGGLRVLEKFGPQKSVCVVFPLDSAAGQFVNAGLALVEAKGRGGSVQRYSSEMLKGAPQTAKSVVSSEYCVTQAFVQGLPWHIQRNEHAIVRSSDQRVIGRFSDFVWYGTWWQQRASPVLGRGGECRHGDPVQAIANTLRAGSQ